MLPCPHAPGAGIPPQYTGSGRAGEGGARPLLQRGAGPGGRKRCRAPRKRCCYAGTFVTSFSFAIAPVVSPGSLAAGQGLMAMDGVVSSGEGMGAMPATVPV